MKTALLLVLALAYIAFVVFQWWQAQYWRREARALADALGTARSDLAQTVGELEMWQQAYAAACAKLGQVRDVITRRPPRRKWLALCHRIARVVA